MMLLGILLVVNTVLAVVFILTVRHPQERIFGLFFLILPGFGPLFYFGPKLWFQVTKKHNLYDVSNVKLKINKETFSQKPNVPEEMNIVAFSEIMEVGQKEEKRSLLLNVLKDDLVDNASFIRSAMSDSDSETTHYAASATMQINTKLRLAIQSLETRQQLDPNDALIRMDLLSAISDYIDSGVLTQRDSDFYRNKYITTFEALKAMDPDRLTCECYLNQADYLLARREAHRGIQVAIEARDRFDREEAHLKLLELYYKTGNQKQFAVAFTAFKNANLTVSNQGLELIRFWSQRSL
jgi:hypothetical protein